MIFMLSLIPVVGFVISLIPLCIIGYNTGGLALTINILVMIAILHVIEGYFLNPKLMSSKMNLPMFYTLVVLLFSEHYIGVWGLILGIPIFVFFSWISWISAGTISLHWNDATKLYHT
ncbi:AI-2E family transporter [Paenibacillus rhizoplanae]